MEICILSLVGPGIQAILNPNHAVVSVSAFLNLGDNPQKPHIGRRSKFYATWCMANGEIVRLRQQSRVTRNPPQPAPARREPFAWLLDADQDSSRARHRQLHVSGTEAGSFAPSGMMRER